MSNDHSPLRHFLDVLLRRKFILLQAVVLMPVVAVLASMQQSPTYEARAEVLLQNQDLAGSLSGTGSSVFTDPSRIAETQARIASTPEVAARTLAAANVTDITTEQLLDQASVTADPAADLLDIVVTDGSGERATLLATEFGRQFSKYKQELDTAAVDGALREARAGIAEIGGRENNPVLFDRLTASEQQLKTLRSLQTSNAFLIRPADSATQTGPRVFRNGILALMLALLVGSALAFGAESLDTRVRRPEDISDGLGIGMIGRLPSPSRRMSANDEIVSLEDPMNPGAEAARLLATNLEFARQGKAVSTVLVTSGVEGEGKSTTAANLAVAVARQGRRVALIDLDLRRPKVDDFFDLPQSPGVVDIVMGRCSLDDVTYTVDISLAPRQGPAIMNRVETSSGGILDVVTAGDAQMLASDIIMGEALHAVLLDLREAYDLVIVDSAPLLRVADTLALTSRMDAVMLVTRLNKLRRSNIRDLRRLIDSTPTRVLGFVLTGADSSDDAGSYYAYAADTPKQRRLGRKTAARS